MKKQILKSLVFLAVMSAAATAMAVTSIEGQVTIGTGSFTPSTKVGLRVISSNVSYAATAVHLAGTKQFGTVAGAGVTGDPSKIYEKKASVQNTTNVIGIPEDPSSALVLGTIGGADNWN